MCKYVVDQQMLIDNIRVIRSLAKDVPVWAVLKGDGYGLGITELAALLRREGISRFCVGEAEEAHRLREAGFTRETILMLQPTTDPETLEQLLELGVICTVSSWHDAVALDRAARRRRTTAQAHLKIDTGMGRYGFLPTEMDEITAVFREKRRIRITGIYTHFARALDSEEATRRQYRQFHYVVDELRSQGLEPGEAHCCNSAAFLNHPEMRMDGVRIGSAFLGRMDAYQRFGLQRVGYCESGIAELHTLERGQKSGYGGAWRAGRRTRLAIVPVGWYHGFAAQYQHDSYRLRDCIRGCLSWLRAWISHRRLWVEIRGQRCPVCGHVGMLYTAVDVTDISCGPGDRVTMDISPLEHRDMAVVYR